MHQQMIYWPILAQIAIPLAVLILNAKRKASARARGEVSKDAAIDNTAWELPVVLTSNNLANQSQLPVLFYVVCLILAQIEGVDALTLGLAWVFVASRVLHAYTHVTSNAIPVRMRSFIFGALILLILYVLTVIKLAT